MLTGSQQFGLLSGITQSFAGRVALVSLLPFAASELRAASLLLPTVNEAVVRGGYPPLFDRPLDPVLWFGNDVQTHLERDVRQLLSVRDLTQFQRFVRLCAGRRGQLLNLSGLGDEVGVSHNTAREWISALEASFIRFRLAPYHRNFNKRLVETPEGVQAIEIKVTATPTTDAMRGLDRWRKRTGEARPQPCLVYGGDTPQRRSDCDVLPWRSV